MNQMLILCWIVLGFKFFFFFLDFFFDEAFILGIEMCWMYVYV